MLSPFHRSSHTVLHRMQGGLLVVLAGGVATVLRAARPRLPRAALTGGVIAVQEI